jgi:hypothetical protein
MLMPAEIMLWEHCSPEAAEHVCTNTCSGVPQLQACWHVPASTSSWQLHAHAHLSPISHHLTTHCCSWLHCLLYTDPVVSSSSSGTQQPATAAPGHGDQSTLNTAAHIRCCSCQRACHVACLPDEVQQQLLAWAAAPQDSTDRDQNKAAPGGKRIRSPRGKKQQSKQDQEEEQQRLQQQQEKERLSRPIPAYFCSAGCKQTATALAKQCAQGLVQLDALPDGTPMCWQLIQPAAVAAALAAAPQPAASSGASAAAADAAGDAATGGAAGARAKLADVFAGAADPPAPVPPSALLGTGVAPAYTLQQAVVLVQVLRDTQQLMSDQLGPAWEVRTYQHCLPWLLSGLRQPTPGVLLDLSHFHVAVLWVGSTLAAAALLRVHGSEGGGVLEVTLAATTPLLQHRRLGRMLVAAVERFALEGCRVKQAWMPALGGVVKPCVGVSVLPGWQIDDGVRGRLQLAPGCSTKVLGLDSSSGSSAGVAAAGSRGQAAEDAAQKVPKGVASCWALKLSYGRAGNTADWLQLTKCPLLRYSYVPFVSKRLDPQTMLPMPQFRRMQPAKPPPLPPLPPQMPLQPRFGMPQVLPPPYLMQQRPTMPWPMMQQQLPPFPMQQPMQQGPGQLHQQAGGVPVGMAGAGAVPEGVMPQSAADAGSRQPEGLNGTLTAAADAPGSSLSGLAQQHLSQQSQQQQDVEALQQAAGATAMNGAVPQQPAAHQQSQQGPASGSAASKRQQWKEQQMQQFLAQQRAFAPPAGPAGAAAAAAASGAAAGSSGELAEDVGAGAGAGVAAGSGFEAEAAGTAMMQD